jgi:hypothetical protein
MVLTISAAFVSIPYANGEVPVPYARGQASRQKPVPSSPMIAGVCAAGLSDSDAKLLKKAGISWIRADVRFSATYANMYRVAERNGLSLIGVLSFKTLEYNSSFTLEDWEDVVDNAQATYPLIRTWEIWNEPSVVQYHLGYMDGTPRHYVDLLKSAYLILKSKDANATVLGLGGAQLGTGDLRFAQDVFSLGGATAMDAISIHAYPYELNKGQTWDYYKQLWTNELKQYSQLGKPLWLTETGLQSTQVTQNDQASYLKASYIFFKDQGMSGFVWYQLVDYVSPTGLSQTWGVLTADSTPKLSYTAYKVVTESS